MNGFLETVASNCLVALALSIVVAAIARFRVNPNVIHVLWLMVLIKFFTPPLLWVPLPWPELGKEDVVEEIVVAADPRVFSPAARGPMPIPQPVVVPKWTWREMLFGIWFAGMAVIVVSTVLRILGFRSLLKRATNAPVEVERLGERLCWELGVRRLPEIFLLPVRITPAVWSLVGRPRILLPAELVWEMNRDQLETILAHELAHIRRRDHLVRLLELAVTTVFWWNPVVWWARRNLREMEEHCCDALVLQTLPDSARRYAIALIETVEFLSEQSGRLPIGATAAKPTVTLTRRIEMLKNGTHVRRLSARGFAAILALLLVPMTLAFAEGEPTSTELKTKVYHLPALDAETVEQDILQRITPKDWAKAGGPYTLRSTKDGSLVVTASPKVHQQVALLLELQSLEKRQQELHKRLRSMSLDPKAVELLLQARNSMKPQVVETQKSLDWWRDHQRLAGENLEKMLLSSDGNVVRIWDLAGKNSCYRCHQVPADHSKQDKKNSYWLDQTVQPSEDAVFLRRITIDLLGVLPTANEIETFRKDRSPNKRRRIVEDLLKRIPKERNDKKTSHDQGVQSPIDALIQQQLGAELEKKTLDLLLTNPKQKDSMEALYLRQLLNSQKPKPKDSQKSQPEKTQDLRSSSKREPSRVSIPALGPEPLAFDWAFPIVGKSKDSQTFRFYMGLNR